MSRASNLAGFSTSISPPSNLTVGVVTATSLSIGGVTATSLNVGVVTATSLNVGVVTATSLNVGVVTATSLNVGVVTATNLTVNGQSIINRVAISTVGVNTTLETGKIYVYFSGVTSVTLPPSPVIGDTLKIINRSGITTALILRNGSNIMGSASDLQFDELDIAYTFTYADNNEGWTLG